MQKLFLYRNLILVMSSEIVGPPAKTQVEGMWEEMFLQSGHMHCSTQPPSRCSVSKLFFSLTYFPSMPISATLTAPCSVEGLDMLLAGELPEPPSCFPFLPLLLAAAVIMCSKYGSTLGGARRQLQPLFLLQHLLLM